MEKDMSKFNSLREFFANDAEFIEAIDDAMIMEKLKTPTKFSIEVEDLEEKLKKNLKSKTNIANDILFANYKRFLYKHILELEKLK